MKSFYIYGVVLFWLLGAQASQTCKPKKVPAPFCSDAHESQLKNYEGIFQETIKNSGPEEILTLVGSKEIKTINYREFQQGAATQTPITIKIDPSITHQSMIGFGAAITESCLENLKRLSPADKQKFLKKVFDRRSGAGFGYLRVPIGANDFSMGDYSLNDTPGNKPDPQLKLYNPQKLQAFIQFIQEAKKYNPDIKIIMSPWSPPAWMKDTNALKGGQIKKKYYEAYSRYLLKTIDEFEAKGIKINQMTILNEPLIDWAKTKWDFPQTYMSPEDQNKFVQNDLSPKLKGRETKILIHDHNWDNAAAADPILSKNKRNPAVQGLAFHCYGGGYSDIQKNFENHPGVPAFNTECSSSFNKDSDQSTFNWWQNTQSLDAVKVGISGSLGWNLCLDETGGPQNNGCKDCRGMVTIDSRTNAMTFNPEFKALAATSMVIDSESKRIESKESLSDTTSLAFKNPDGSLSMVLKNKSNTSQSYKVNLDDCTIKQYQLPAGATLSTRWFPN
jgi:glucosylceramidase